MLLLRLKLRLLRKTARSIGGKHRSPRLLQLRHATKSGLLLLLHLRLHLRLLLSKARSRAHPSGNAAHRRHARLHWARAGTRAKPSRCHPRLRREALLLLPGNRLHGCRLTGKRARLHAGRCAHLLGATHGESRSGRPWLHHGASGGAGLPVSNVKWTREGA